MSLWTMTDEAAGKPKYLSDDLRNAQTVSDKDATIGIDASEAAASGSIAKGLNTPGWVTYTTYTDANGNVRHKSEVLVASGSMGTDGTATLVDDLSPSSGSPSSGSPSSPPAASPVITGTMTIGLDSGSYGAGTWGATPVGSLDEDPAGSIIFISGNQTATTIHFANGSWQGLTTNYGTLNGNGSVIVNVNGISRTFTVDVMGQHRLDGDVFMLGMLGAGVTVPFTVTLA